MLDILSKRSLIKDDQDVNLSADEKAEIINFVYVYNNKLPLKYFYQIKDLP